MQRQVEIRERDFFKSPFSRREVEALLQGRPGAEMFNFRSPSFKKIGVEKHALTNEELVERMLEEPRLIRRPVVRIGKHVYFGADSNRLGEILG